MKKHLIVPLFLLLLTLTLTLILNQAPTAHAALSTVYLSSSGSDSGDGTQEAPYLTMEKALDAVSDGGVIQILDRITLDTSFKWKSHGKAVTVTGGVLDLTAFGQSKPSTPLHIQDDVTFTDIELTFATIEWTQADDKNSSGKNTTNYMRTIICANGHHLVIAPDVRFTNTYNTNVWLLGGAYSGKTVNGDTNLEVYAGTYTAIFGGGLKDTVKGDTHVTVGGTVNANAVTTNHSHNYCIFGGGWDGTVEGDTYLTIMEDAKANYAYGGAYEANGKVHGYANATLAGGELMHLGGGGQSANQEGLGANVTVTGGTVQQIFGGSIGGDFGSASNPVNVNIRILGGTVTRRIYGGCYNEYGILSGYSTAYHVWGNIILTLDANANIPLNASDADKVIFARSRYSKAQTGEHSTIIFAGSAAYTKFKGKLNSSVSSASAADEQHICTYTANGGTVTEACSFTGCNHTATAAITLDPGVSLVYSGQAIKPAHIEYSSGWKGEKTFALTYSDNINAGTATAAISNDFASASLNFNIEKAPSLYNAPVLDKIDETYTGRADGKITGLTTVMEYSTGGTAYIAVTDPDRDFPVGTYYVRYCADANHNPSAVTELTIGTKKHEHTCEKCGATDWTAWTDGTALPSTSGHYYLTTDVALPEGATIGSALDITLCLYGHDINLNQNNISLSGKLTICDCTAAGEGDTYTAGSLYGGKGSTGGAINSSSGSELNLYDGIIKDCAATGNGGAVCLGSNSKFFMHGGKISGSTSGNAGGAVFLSGATTAFHMTGGRISGNQAKNGGAIGAYNTTATLENGTICGNTALSTGGNGGAIYMSGTAKVTLTGMTITGNTGTISSAISLLNTAQCTVTDSVITGNTGSPAVRMNTTTSKLILAGRTQIQKNAAGNVSLIKDHPGVDVSGLSAGAKVGVTLAADRFSAEQMYITAEMTEGADPSAYVVSDDEKYEVRLEGNQLVLGAAIHTHCVCGKEGCTQHEMITFTPWEDANALPSTSGHYYLTTDVALSESATMDTSLDITLCLHGHDINLGQNNISLSGKLTICDCTAGGEGDTYTAGSLYGGTGSTGGAINSSSGSELYLYDGIIKDCAATGNGGAVCLGSNSKFFMHGGKICGSTSGNAGGAVFLSGATTAFHMTGGTISGNQAKNGGAIGAYNTTATLENGTICGNTALSTGGNGGAIYASGTSKVTLTGMTITGNTGTVSSAISLLNTAQCTVTDSVITGNTGSPAVRMNNTTSNLTLAGTTKIRKNTNGNVYLIKGHPGVDVSGLSAGAKVGVTLAADRISAGQIYITAEMTEGVDPSAYVVSDDKNYGVKLEGRQLVLGEPIHTHCVCGDEDCTDHTQVEYQAWDKTDSLPTSGNYYLTADVTLSDQTILSKNGNLKLCLNGHTVTGSSAKRILAMPLSGCTVTVSDCTATIVDGVYTAGKLTGAYHNGTGGGGAFFITKGSTLNLYDGIITDNGCHNNGGAVYIQGVMNMYGGQISDNKAYETKKGVTTWKNGGNICVCSEGSFTMYDGKICSTVQGVAADKGGAVYMEADAAVTINGGTIENCTAFSGGHDIYQCLGATLAIGEGVQTTCRYGTDLSGIVSVTDIKENSLVSDGDFNQVAWLDANTIRITRNDNFLDAEGNAYRTLQSAVDAVAGKENQVITLNTYLTEDITISGDVILDLNNKTLTGDITLENGAKLSGMDSATDRYGESEYGKICGTITDGGVKKTFQNANSKKRYVAVHDEENGTWTFNRFYIGMKSINANVNTGDVGYKAIVGGNEKVKNALADSAFGFKVWVESHDDLAQNPTLTKNNFVTGDTGTTIKLRIANQLKYINDLYVGNKKDDATELQNKNVIAQVTIYFADGTYEVSSEYKYSIVQMYQALDAEFDDFTTAQKDSMAKLIENFPVMTTWNLTNTMAFASNNTSEGDS